MRSEAKTITSKISYWTFLKNRRAMMAALSAMFAMIFMMFFDGILAVQLRKQMGVSANSVGNNLSNLSNCRIFFRVNMLYLCNYVTMCLVPSY
jgi:hypothetical protein